MQVVLAGARGDHNSSITASPYHASSHNTPSVSGISRNRRSRTRRSRIRRSRTRRSRTRRSRTRRSRRSTIPVLADRSQHQKHYARHRENCTRTARATCNTRNSLRQHTTLALTRQSLRRQPSSTRHQHANQTNRLNQQPNNRPSIQYHRVTRRNTLEHIGTRLRYRLHYSVNEACIYLSSDIPKAA